jgi:hypothetical protein
MDETEKYGFLTEAAPDEALPEVAATPEPVAQVETPATPAPAAPTAAEPLEGTHVPLAALKAERDKRQNYERELADLRKQIALQQPAAPEPNFYEAPEQYVQQVVQSERQQMTQALYSALEADARDAHADYDEVLAELNEAARDNPVIRQQVFASPNPAKAAYKLGKQLREMKAMQDPAAYRASVEADIRASIKAEQDAAAASKAAAVAAIPPDLAATRSAVTAEPVTGDFTLDSILKERKRR